MPVDLIKKKKSVDLAAIAKAAGALDFKAMFRLVLGSALALFMVLGLAISSTPKGFLGLKGPGLGSKNVVIKSDFPPTNFSLWHGASDLGFSEQNFEHCPVNTSLSCYKVQAVSRQTCSAFMVSVGVYKGNKRVRFKTLGQYTVPQLQIVDFYFEYNSGQGLQQKVENITCS
jgi:hypothetical protein